jgi:hypothetical protein
MTIARKIISLFVLSVILCTQAAQSQTNDLQQTMRKLVDYYKMRETEGSEWEKTKEALANYSPQELEAELIADLDVERGYTFEFVERNDSIRKLYSALSLPPAYVCKELESIQTPQHKAALIWVLRGQNSPEVTTALLQQLKDRRPAVEYIGFPEEPVRPMRVCDVACNTLHFNLCRSYESDNVLYMNYSGDDSRRDEIIRETLKYLKLSVPQ